MMKNKLIIVAVVLILLIAGGVFFLSSKRSKTQSTPTQTDTSIIPTVDSSVKVDVENKSSTHELTLSVTGIPKGTDTIDYELSYETEEQGLQGLIGTLDTAGKSDASKTITLGTCSSGTCVYHKVKGSIKATLKFNGSYGEQVFEREFAL